MADLLESQVTKIPHFQRLLDIFLNVATGNEAAHVADANTLRIPRIPLRAALDSGPTARREDGGQLPPINLLVVAPYLRSSVGSAHGSHRCVVHRQPMQAAYPATTAVGQVMLAERTTTISIWQAKTVIATRLFGAFVRFVSNVCGVRFLATCCSDRVDLSEHAGSSACSRSPDFSRNSC